MAGKPWYPREDSNPSLIVRSDLSFPIERRGQNLVGRGELESPLPESESGVLAAERPPYGWETGTRTQVKSFKGSRPGR